MAENCYYEKNYDVNSYNCDKDFKLRFSSLVDFLQDISLFHSESVNCGYNEMTEMGFAWILYKWKIRVISMPRVGDTLCIRTWSAGMDKRQAYRNYRVFTKSGELIGEALSIWFIIDIKKRMIVPVSDEIKNKYTNSAECIFHNDFTNNPLGLAKDIISESHYTVRRHDLDYNNHVNNVKYIEMFFDTIPERLLNDNNRDNTFLYDFEVTYKRECFFNDELSCVCFDSANLNNYDISDSTSILTKKHIATNTIISIIKNRGLENNRLSNVTFKLEINNTMVH